jgi:hypothetical protein
MILLLRHDRLLHWPVAVFFSFFGDFLEHCDSGFE